MAKVLGEIAEQGVKFGVKQVGKAFKKLTPSALDNLRNMGREMNISPKSMYDLDLHLKKVPEDAADVESIFKGMKAEDPDAFEAADGFFHNLGVGNDAAAKIEADDLANPARKAVTGAHWPKAYNVTGPEGREYVHGKLSQWLKEQQGLVESGQITKIDRSQFAPEGLMIDGQERGISGISEHIRSGYKSRIKMDSLGPAQARARQADPANVQGLKEWFESGHQTWKETGGAEGIHPDLNFDEYRTSILRGAAKADKVTSELANELGIKLDKEHMASLGGRGSNDPRSQMPGSETLNRRMGKIDSFSNEVMLILGLPGSGGKAAKKYKNPKVQAKANQREQVGWLQSVTDWVATDGASLDDMASWNPGDLLTNSDKLRIQRAFKTGNQIEVAQTILAERQIAEAYRKAGLGTTPNEKAILNKVLKNIDTDEKVLKAKAKK